MAENSKLQVYSPDDFPSRSHFLPLIKSSFASSILDVPPPGRLQCLEQMPQSVPVREVMPEPENYEGKTMVEKRLQLSPSPLLHSHRWFSYPAPSEPPRRRRLRAEYDPAPLLDVDALEAAGDVGVPRQEGAAWGGGRGRAVAVVLLATKKVLTEENRNELSPSRSRIPRTH